MFQGAVSRWKADAGRSPESGMSRVSYDKYRQVYNDPISNRVLHWFDEQNIIGAFQDRLIATEGYMKEIFASIPTYCLYNDDEYTGATRDIGNSSDQIHI